MFKGFSRSILKLYDVNLLRITCAKWSAHGRRSGRQLTAALCGRRP